MQHTYILGNTLQYRGRIGLTDTCVLTEIYECAIFMKYMYIHGHD
jgi:hypothetical protein